MGEKIKLPSAWLIEKCGFRGKGKREQRPVGVHECHALILVNYGKASGDDIIDLMVEVQNAVYNKFGVRLIPEVNIV
jgi:UDP-N-acetylmuramate dehydrogenase